MHPDLVGRGRPLKQLASQKTLEKGRVASGAFAVSVGEVDHRSTSGYPIGAAVR